MTIFSTILVPYDFSETAEHAFHAACELAAESGAKVHLLHVLEPPHYAFAGDIHVGLGATRITGIGPFDGLVETCRARLDEVARNAPLPSDRVHVHVAESGGVPRSIASAAKDLDADLIAMGTHGRTGLAHLILGSVAEATLRNASCPVLTVPLRREAVSRSGRVEASRHPPLGAL